jgi:hypothetical protein
MSAALASASKVLLDRDYLQKCQQLAETVHVLNSLKRSLAFENTWHAFVWDDLAQVNKRLVRCGCDLCRPSNWNADLRLWVGRGAYPSMSHCWGDVIEFAPTLPDGGCRLYRWLQDKCAAFKPFPLDDAVDAPSSYRQHVLSSLHDNQDRKGSWRQRFGALSFSEQIPTYRMMHAVYNLARPDSERMSFEAWFAYAGISLIPSTNPSLG